MVQRPTARASRRKDEFVWYDKMSGETTARKVLHLCRCDGKSLRCSSHPDTFVKPNLWLLVNPSIACPIQYGETPPEPAETRHPIPAEPRLPRVQEGLPAPEHPVLKHRTHSEQVELLSEPFRSLWRSSGTRVLRPRAAVKGEPRQ